MSNYTSVSRSQIIKRRKAYKRKRTVKRVIFSICGAVVLLFVFAISMLIFYIAIDDGDEFSSSSSQVSSENTDKNISSFSEVGDFSVWNEECDFNLIVVNKDNELPKNFEEELVDFKGFKIDRRIEDKLSKMIEDAENDSVTLWISSAYRGIKLQAEIMDDEIAVNMNKGSTRKEAEELAKQLVAEPRKSEHLTGLAIDFNGVSDDFKNTEAYKWLTENAHKYGFILRYPESKKDVTGMNFEPRHFRYVGVSAAKAMHGKDICLEEYIESIK